jgi:DNA-binding transcriptional ArsR family regulator
MVEKILNLDLNDENSSTIAEILGNKTCKKILGFIAENEGLSETDISRKLAIPANTINYNIKKLVKAGLIEETKNFFWSVKGRKIKTFKLANKKIIISTKKSFKSLLVSAITFGFIGLLVKLGLNYRDINSFNGSQGLFLEKSADLSYAAPSVASNLAEGSREILQTTSVFQNLGLWFICGLLMGVVFYVSYKKLKGGLK